VGLMILLPAVCTSRKNAYKKGKRTTMVKNFQRLKISKRTLYSRKFISVQNDLR
jgi:hypothetical protein